MTGPISACYIFQAHRRSVQLSPQDVDLIASPNHEAVVEFGVALADVPVDIYFLLDLSGSMASHRENLYRYMNHSVMYSTMDNRLCLFDKTDASLFL